MNIFRNRRFGYFVGGLLTAIVGKEILKSSKTRNVMVKTMAKGMKLQKDAQVYMQNMREDAVDLCYEAQKSELEGRTLNVDGK